MTMKRWWDLAFAGTLLLMALIAIFDEGPSPAFRVGALITLGVIAVSYVAVGRRAFENRTASVVFLIVLIVGSGLAVFFSPNLATLQALVFPLLWVLSSSTWVAILLSGLLALSVGLGFYSSVGGGTEMALRAAGIEGISFLFALVLGLWITRIERDGAKHKLLLQELTAAQGELAALHRDAGRAAERERLAREIHDTIAQSLTSLVMLAQRANTELTSIPAAGSSAGGAVVGGAVAGDAATVGSVEGGALAGGSVVSGPVVSGSVSASSVASDSVIASPRLARTTSTLSGVAAARVSVDLIEATARDALTEARSLVAAMSPVRVGDSTLAEAVGRLAARFTQETGIQVDVAVQAGGIDRELEVVLLRCAQEGLANVRKHSRASTASVSLTDSGEELTLEVRDDGRGLGDYSPNRETGFGLAGMRDRVDLVGGRLDVAGGDAGGTVLRVSVPVGGVR